MDGGAVFLPLVAREEFRQPVNIEVEGRFGNAREDPAGLFNEAVPPETGRDNRVIVRPDRAEMVVDRIVAQLVSREGADP